MPRHLLTTVYLPTFIMSLSYGLLLPVMPLFVSSFEVSYGLIGLVLAGEALGMLLMDIPAGRILSYLDRKWVMLLGVALVGLSVLALLWSSSIWLVLLWRVLAGVGGALWNLSRHAYLTEVTHSSERGRAIAVFGGTTRIGIFAGPALGGFLATRWGFDVVFVVVACLAVLTLVLAQLFVKLAQGPVQARTGLSLLSVLGGQRRILLSAGSGQLFAQMIRAARQVIIPLFGSVVLGLDVLAVGLILTISSFVDMSLFYPAGLLMDRLGRRFAIVPSFLLQAVGMALIPFAGGFSTLLLAACVIGFGNGLGSGTMMTIGSDLAPKDRVGEFLGLWRFIGDGGSVGGPVAVGLIVDVLSFGPAAWIMAGVGGLSAAVFLWLVPETLAKTAKSHSTS